ncbi:MAG: hypothetical protein JRD69_09990 [Deltaproteobacteria bacterium]|nr:hypothetical protein [Deltaproteobacteria bacterium]
MSEPIRTLWFEDVGFLNEPMLDTPIGRFSIRQTVAFLVFGLLAWAATLFFEDLMLKIVVAGAVFFLGAAIFTRRVKTITPERHLLLILGIGRPLKKSVKTKKKRKYKGQPKPSAPVKSMVVSATLDAPVKLVGVLKDPSTGKLLPHRGFEIYVDGKPYSAGTTDEHGFFNVFFVPEQFGTFKIEVKPEGFADVAQQITINVKSTKQFSV